MRVGLLIAALLCFAFSTPNASADARTAIDTTGKTATEVIQIAEAAGAFAPSEPDNRHELVFRHELTGLICRVPIGSRMWLYVGNHDRRGDSSSCFYTDDFRHTGIVIFRQALGNSLDEQMKIADEVCLRFIPTPTIIADDLWAAVTAQAPEATSIRYRGEVEGEGPFFCAVSVAEIDGWTFIYTYLARVYSEEEAARWDRDALERWRATLRELNEAR